MRSEHAFEWLEHSPARRHIRHSSSRTRGPHFILCSFLHSATSPSVFRVWDIVYSNTMQPPACFSSTIFPLCNIFNSFCMVPRSLHGLCCPPTRDRDMIGSRLPTEVQEPDECMDRQLSPYNILASQLHPAYDKTPRTAPI